jgi:hypothetical protein
MNVASSSGAGDGGADAADDGLGIGLEDGGVMELAALDDFGFNFDDESNSAAPKDGDGVGKINESAWLS